MLGALNQATYCNYDWLQIKKTVFMFLILGGCLNVNLGNKLCLDLIKIYIHIIKLLDITKYDTALDNISSAT